MSAFFPYNKITINKIMNRKTQFITISLASVAALSSLIAASLAFNKGFRSVNAGSGTQNYSITIDRLTYDPDNDQATNVSVMTS